jgi:hypothetical protein
VQKRGVVNLTSDSDSKGSNRRAGPPAFGFVLLSHTWLSPTPQKHRHDRHLLAASELTDDDLFDADGPLEATLEPIETYE